MLEISRDNKSHEESVSAKIEARLFIGGVPKNVTDTMIVARFAAVPSIKVKEVLIEWADSKICH